MNDAPQIMDQTDKKVFTILLVVVGVICIVVVGVTAAAFYTVNTAREKQIASLATEQARATSTAVSATSTAIYQATQVAGYQFFDDFDDNESNWGTGQEDNKYWRGSISVRDGAYIWNIREFYESDYAGRGGSTGTSEPSRISTCLLTPSWRLPMPSCCATRLFFAFLPMVFPMEHTYFLFVTSNSSLWNTKAIRMMVKYSRPGLIQTPFAQAIGILSP